MKRNVLVDCDGVLIDLCSGIKKYLNRQGKNLIIENIETYNFGGNIGCSRSDVFDALNHLSTFQLADYYDGAVKALEKLQSVAETHSYTGVPENIFIIGHRNKQLEDLKLQGSAIYGKKGVTSGNKSVISGEWNAVFEDSIETLANWVDIDGVKLYLIDHTYNRKDTNPQYDERVWNKVIRCSDFADAVNKYCSSID